MESEFQPEEYPEELAESEIIEEEEDFESVPYFSGEEIPEEEEEEEYEEDGEFVTTPKEQAIPDIVKNFVQLFHKHIQERSIHNINLMCDNFHKITEKYYQKSAWPPAEAISQYCDNDPLTLILYKELSFRHIYSKNNKVSLDIRIASWNNYSTFWNYLLNASNEFNLVIPHNWLWEMVDEFIYQFESFCQYSLKLKNKTPEEINTLKANPQVWNVVNVINFLQSLVNKSNIVQILEKEKLSTKEDSEPHIQTPILFKNLGYFCLVGLLRVHCLLGDYYLALKTVSPIELSKNAYARVVSCHVALYYYMGFTYMMLRRYSDAIKIFNNILVYISRTKQHQSRTYQSTVDQFAKKSERLYGLLAICLAFCPQRVDENVQTYLRDKFSEKTAKIQKKDLSVFEELFLFGCPKFVSPAVPNYDEVLQDPSKHQNYKVYYLLNI